MPAEAAEGAVSRTRERKTSTSYALGLLCECGARRSDGSRRWCAECRHSNAPWEMSSVEAATRHGGGMLMACSHECAAMPLARGRSLLNL